MRQRTFLINERFVPTVRATTHAHVLHVELSARRIFECVDGAGKRSILKALKHKLVYRNRNERLIIEKNVAAEEPSTICRKMGRHDALFD